MTIARLIEGRSGEIVACDTQTSVRDAVRLLAERRIGAMPVYAGGKVAGIFSERDVVYELAEQGRGVLDKTVGEVMTSPPITVSPATDVLEALGLMTRRRIRHLPVVDGEQMTAFVSIGDLVKHRIDRVVADAEAMRAYIQSA